MVNACCAAQRVVCVDALAVDGRVCFGEGGGWGVSN